MLPLTLTVLFLHHIERGRDMGGRAVERSSTRVLPITPAKHDVWVGGRDRECDR